MIAATTLAALEAHFEGLNWGCFENTVSVLAPDFTWHCHCDTTPYCGIEGYLAYLHQWRTAFPDGWWELADFNGGADFAVCRSIFRGTQQGLLETSLGFIAPTGHTVDLPMCEVFQMRDGRLAGIDTYYDVATLVRQLGHTPGVGLRPYGLLRLN